MGWRNLPVLLICGFMVRTLSAEVTLDGTLGPAGALAGPHYSIPADLGRQVGGNLFHSFGRFGLNNGESATFSGPASVNNVIGRVTGGEPSGIDGTIRSTIPRADLYLINPAGVMFGPNARLEVDGSFHASTAHHVKLEDGGRFDVAEPRNSSLTAAPVAAFGFLDRPAAPVTVEGSVLHVPQGDGLSLVGGDVRIVNGTLYAPGGRIDLAAAGPGAEVVLTDGGIETRGGSGSGEVEIVQTGERPVVGGVEVPNLTTTSTGGGSVHITGGRISLQGASVEIGTLADGDAGRIDIAAQGDVRLDASALVMAATVGSGAGGDVAISSGGSLELSGGSFVGAFTTGGGSAGDVRISSGRLLVEGESSIISSTGDTGSAGRIDIETDRMEVRDKGLITSSTRGGGNGGSVHVHTAEDLELGSGGAISSFSSGSGDAGSLNLTVGGLLTLDDASSVSASTLASGDAGKIGIDAGRVEVSGRSWIACLTSGSGRAGDIRIGADQFLLAGESNVTSDTAGSGEGGSVRIDVNGSLLVSGNAFIGAHSVESQSGNAGTIEIRAADLQLQDQGQIGTSTNGAGDGGDVRLVVDRLRVLNGGIVSNDTFFGTGDSGSIDISAAESVLVSGRHGPGSVSAISAYSLPGASGDAGRIHIDTPYLEVSSEGRIIASTASSGRGGDIRIDVDRLLLADSGQILANTVGAGRGGDIELRIAGDLGLTGGSILAATSDAEEGGDGGGILISAPSLEISDGAYVEVSTYGSGNAGTVGVTVDRLVMTEGGTIDASSVGSGSGGRIAVDASESAYLGGSGANELLTFIGSIAAGSGKGGSVVIHTPELELAGWTQIASSAASSGQGGTVTIDTSRLTLRDGGQVRAITLGSGRGGDIFIDTSSGVVLLEGDPETSIRSTEISADSLGEEATGDAGDIDIRTGELMIDGAAYVSTSSEGGGRGGDLRVTADTGIDIRGHPVYIGGLFANTTGTGDGGSIEVTAPQVDLSAHGFIDVRSLGTGFAGNILLVASRLLRVDDAIVSATSALTSGGIIRVAAGSTQLTNGGRISASVFGDEHSDGGNVTVSGINLAVLEGSRITATAAVGRGGRIVIDTDVFLHDAATLGDVLDASSGTAGNDGTVDVNAPELDISGSLVALSGSFLDAGGGLGRSCDAARAGRRSSLLVRGRDAMPGAPVESGLRTDRDCGIGNPE